MANPGLVPTTVLTGFLGAGKTTLLQRLLTADHGRRLAVLVNDFSELNIDAELLPRGDGRTVQLANGCICCSLRDDLSEAVLALLDRPDPPEHLVIEASGISDPVAIAELLHRIPLSARVSVDAMIAVVDAEQYPALSFGDGETALSQLAVADIALINKIDLARPAVVETLSRDLRLIVPKARIMYTRYCDVPLEVLLGGSSGTSHAAQAHECGHGPGDGSRRLHDHRFRSLAWTSDAPLALDRFRSFVRDIPSSVFRAKGFVELDTGTVQRALFQLVGKRSSLDFDAAAAGGAGTRMVFITREAEADLEALRAGLQACVVAGTSSRT